MKEPIHATALIIGASRGIGHELVRQYRADGWRVIATARKPQDLAELRRSAPSAPARRHQRRSRSPAWAGNSTTKRSTPPGWSPASTARATTASRPSRNSTPSCTPTCWPRCACCRSSRRWWRNARGKLARAVLAHGLDRRAQQRQRSLYRASKAALNSVLRDTALTYGPQGATCVAFHPGWVQTDMGGAGADAHVEQSVRDLRATLAKRRPKQRHFPEPRRHADSLVSRSHTTITHETP
jgi:NAD(P)-dependent dehydrogenase (short-subunit alcohol dehydrogenase family)